jgi:hypothetical protein
MKRTHPQPKLSNLNLNYAISCHYTASYQSFPLSILYSSFKNCQILKYILDLSKLHQSYSIYSQTSPLIDWGGLVKGGQMV